LRKLYIDLDKDIHSTSSGLKKLSRELKIWGQDSG